MSWYTIFDLIESNGWRKQIMEFVAKIENMPVPEVFEAGYTPSLEWGAGLRLSRDYLDFEVYEIHNLQWRQVTEEEFLDWMRIQYSL